jgi:hypothetical protein
MDGSASHEFGHYLMVLTPKELAACRVHDVDINNDPYNMGGC